VVDKVAAEIDIEIELQPGVSPDVTIDALYAFTDCEVSISPNCCVIVDNKPLFTDVNEMLRISHRKHQGTAPHGVGNPEKRSGGKAPFRFAGEDFYRKPHLPRHRGMRNLGSRDSNH
jgi:hypothetical protein